MFLTVQLKKEKEQNVSIDTSYKRVVTLNRTRSQIKKNMANILPIRLS